MKHLFSFLLGALLMVAIGVVAQRSGDLIFKPATPKQTLVRSFNGFHNVKMEIEKDLAKGWMMKAMTMGKYEIIVVYEKY